jgi:hypothetical protein
MNEIETIGQPNLEPVTRALVARTWHHELLGYDAGGNATKRALAPRERRFTDMAHEHPAGAGDEITIRLSGPEDSAAILRLAELDGRRAPSGESILAIVGGELRAALALGGREVVADPFWPTTELVELLRVRDAALQDTGTGHRRPLRARVAFARR